MIIDYDKGPFGNCYVFDTSNIAGKVLADNLWICEEDDRTITLTLDKIGYGLSVLRSPNGIASTAGYSTNDPTVRATGMLFSDGSSTFVIECLNDIVGVYNFTHPNHANPVIRGREFDFKWTHDTDTRSEVLGKIEKFNNSDLAKASDLISQKFCKSLPDHAMRLDFAEELAAFCKGSGTCLEDLASDLNDKSSSIEDEELGPADIDDTVRRFAAALGIKFNDPVN